MYPRVTIKASGEDSSPFAAECFTDKHGSLWAAQGLIVEVSYTSLMLAVALLECDAIVLSCWGEDFVYKLVYVVVGQASFDGIAFNIIITKSGWRISLVKV